MLGDGWDWSPSAQEQNSSARHLTLGKCTRRVGVVTIEPPAYCPWAQGTPRSKPERKPSRFTRDFWDTTLAKSSQAGKALVDSGMSAKKLFAVISPLSCVGCSLNRPEPPNELQRSTLMMPAGGFQSQWNALQSCPRRGRGRHCQR